MKKIIITRPKGYLGLGPNYNSCFPSLEFVTELSLKLKENPDANELSIECDHIYIPSVSGQNDNSWLEFAILPQECTQITKMCIKIENIEGDVLQWLLEAMSNVITLELIDTRIKHSYHRYTVGWRKLNIENLPSLKNLILNNVKIPISALRDLLSGSHNILEKLELNINKEDLESARIEHGRGIQDYNQEKLIEGFGELPEFPQLSFLSVNQSVLDVILRSTMNDTTRHRIGNAASESTRQKIISDFTCVALCFKHTTAQLETKKIAEGISKDVIRSTFTYLYDKNSIAFKKAFPAKKQELDAELSITNKKMRGMSMS